jgi:hypothetical protein
LLPLPLSAGLNDDGRPSLTVIVNVEEAMTVTILEVGQSCWIGVVVLSQLFLSIVPVYSSPFTIRFQ